MKRLLARLRSAAAAEGDERLREEVESHIALQAEDNVRAGLPPEEARRRARVAFGSVDAVREDYRAELGLPPVEDLLLDVRCALRGLRRSPAFAAVAASTLMFSIGANVFVLGVLKAVLLPRLDVSEPDRLYQVRVGPPVSGRLLTTSYPAFQDLQQRTRTFSGVAGFNGYSGGTLSWRDGALAVNGYEVTGNYFDLLGAQPALGRFFHPADEQGARSARVLVLSDHLWRRGFHADPDVVGTTVRLGEDSFTVVGVASPRFRGTERFHWPDYWIPIVSREGDSLQSRTRNALTVIGRLRPGVTPEQATEDLNAIAGQLADEHPRTDRRAAWRLIGAGLFGDIGGAIRGFLFGVNALALLLLLAACANLASLFAARTADRAREMAVRVALGSSRLRLTRLLLTEALLVSSFGGAGGLVGAHLLLGALSRWQPPFAYGAQRLAVSIEGDVGIYAAGLAMTLGSAVLFGMVPAWRAWHGSPLQVMKRGPLVPAHRRLAAGDLVLGAQVAICTLLVTGSLVALHGLARALDGPIGIKPDGALLAEVELGPAGRQAAGTLERARSMIEAARGLPGVTAAAAATDLPLGRARRPLPVYRPGTTEFLPDNAVSAAYAFPVSPGYLEAAGTRLVAGRDVTWHDTGEAPSVAIVNQTFARTMWGDAPALGRHFHLAERLTEVVGVAEDGKYHDLMEPPQAAVYVPLATDLGTRVALVVRSRLEPGEGVAALRRTMSALEPNAPLTVRSWPEGLANQLIPARMAAWALGVLGFLAALLAVTGISGMAAYTVSRRKKELGIRRALGGGKAHVLGAAVGRPALLLAAGSVVGLLAAGLASRLLGAIVYQADPGHPAVSPPRCWRWPCWASPDRPSPPGPPSRWIPPGSCGKSEG